MTGVEWPSYKHWYRLTSMSAAYIDPANKMHYNSTLLKGWAPYKNLYPYREALAVGR